ncbi:MAG TPA: hypothetical protein VK540_16015 [Polyangiaceae bacterium]|nr:hypothetical protein [Polyangiaceae bacterium]
MTTAEMRIGFSLYWVQLSPQSGGWEATWRQNDKNVSVWTTGTSRDALAEARRIAEANEPAPTVVS